MAKREWITLPQVLRAFMARKPLLVALYRSLAVAAVLLGASAMQAQPPHRVHVGFAVAAGDWRTGLGVLLRYRSTEAVALSCRFTTLLLVNGLGCSADLYPLAGKPFFVSLGATGTVSLLQALITACPGCGGGSSVQIMGVIDVGIGLENRPTDARWFFRGGRTLPLSERGGQVGWFADIAHR